MRGRNKFAKPSCSAQTRGNKGKRRGRAWAYENQRISAVGSVLTQPSSKSSGRMGEV